MAVLVAVDDCAGAPDAIRVAAQEARWRKTPLVAVTAYRTEMVAVAAGEPPHAPLPPEQDRQGAEVALRDAVTAALGDCEGAELRIVTGQPGRAVIETARQVRAELIVLAARSGASMLPGSVSQQVLRNAACPVLVIPAGGIALV